MDSAGWRRWLDNDSYFDDLAVFSMGPLHPGGITASRQLLQALEWPGKRVLDAGCGNGTTIRLLESVGAECIGLERSPIMRRVAIQSGLQAGQIHPCDISRMPFEPPAGIGDFDVILFEGVLGFITSPISTVFSIAELLRKAGQIVVCDWVPQGRARASRSEYGFVPIGRTEPTSLARRLDGAGFACSIVTEPTSTKPFSLPLSEAIRRAQLVFGEVPDGLLERAVERKCRKMRAALLGAFEATRYLLVAAR